MLLENPRYLTRVKNYPDILLVRSRPDHPRRGPGARAVGRPAGLDDLANGAVHRKDTVSAADVLPAGVAQLHSQVMPFYPGDILSTGTPGAASASSPASVVRCELGDGMASLTNPVL